MHDINFENHFRDLFENTNDLVYFLNIDGIIQLVNPAWLSTLGYKEDEAIGRSIYDFVHPDFIENYKIIRRDVILNNKTGDVEIPFITKQNEIIIGEGQLGCSYKNGKPIYTRCVYKNITSRKFSEKQIHESEKRLKSFFASAPVAVIVIDEAQQIVEWNPKAENIFGFTKEEISGKTLSETIIPGQYREAHNRGMHHFLKTGEGPVLNKSIEITALNKSGKEFYISLNISNVMIDDRWLFVAFITDISERKKTEDALIKKEAELLQSKLLDEKKDEFISIASHELKTPLTTIKAYLHVALKKCKDCPEEVSMYLSKMSQLMSKLTFLLDELLDISKIQLGKLNISPSEVDVNIFLEETLNSIQHITNNHQIIIDKNATVKTVFDPVRLEQVIVNLVSNAAKYSPGRDKIIVNSVVENDEILISVTDYGIGIPGENIDKIFNRFYRVDESDRQFSGLGIGLFISSEIVKQHGGKIWVESNVGEGSTFNFTLPLLN